MNNRTVTHTTFTIERSYPHSPDRVFRAFADPDLKRGWFSTPADWVGRQHTIDFRPGGREVSRGGPAGGDAHTFDALYHQIIDGERIVYSYDLLLGDQQISVSLATIEFRADGTGTTMTFTEQGAFFDGIDDPANRETGTKLLLDALGDFLGAQA